MNDHVQDWLHMSSPTGRQKRADPSDQVPALMKYWRIVVRRKWIIAGIMTGALIAGLIITLLMTPKFTATATIEIARQQEKIVQVQSVEPEYGAADEEFYQTQYSLLQARSLAESVMKDLRLAEDNNFFALFGVDPDEGGIFTKNDNGRLTPERRAKREKEAVEILLKNVTISPIRQSRLVYVSFTSPDPNLSQRVTNSWTDNFIESNLARRFDATSYARTFLEQRLEQLRKRLEESERALVGYAASQRIINIASSDTATPGAPRQERSLVAEDLEALNKALAEATADRIRAQSRNAGQGASSTEALTNQALSTMRQKRAEISADYARMMAQFEPEYPAAVALRSQVAQLDRSIVQEEGRIRQNLSGGYAEAAGRERALQGKVQELKSNLLDLRRRSIQYNIFQRDVDTNRQLYDGLLQRYKEIGVAGGVGTNNVSIVDPAIVPDKPSSPRLLLNLILALIAGILASGAVALALEQIDEAIKDPSDFGQATGLALLGAIPKTDTDEPIHALQDRKSSLTEAYLSVQTNLQFTTDHGVPRSLAVTSTRAGEGKSTTSFAIALSLARTGRRVILVDADMRSPSVNEILGISNGKGLSNYLSGDDELDPMIQASEQLKLSALPAGPQPPNAAELLTSQRLKMLIERLLTNYDHVVIDSPPVLGLADAPLIASSVEGAVYAVQAQGVRSSMIKAALARLNNSNTNLLGGVLTKFDAKKAHLGYGYDYGYGYGQTPTENA